jgi:hypothetical protein
MRAAETNPSGWRNREQAVILPAVLVVPRRLPSGIRVAHCDGRIGERLAADVVSHGLVGEQTDLALVLLGAGHVVLARSVVHGRADLHLELGKVELFEVAREDEGPDALEILRGQHVARFEVGLGILVFGQPLVKGGSSIALDVLRHSGTHAKQRAGYDQQARHRGILAPRPLSRAWFA